MPVIGQPLQGYYYDLGTDTLRPMAGTPGAQGVPGPAQYGITFVGDATANVTLTSMAAAEDYFNGTVRYGTRLDLAGYTQCRMVMRKMATAGAAGSKVMLKYSTTNPANTFSGAAWTASGAECVLTGTNTTVDSGWITMPAGMQANDLYIIPTQSGGDGATSPVVGGLWVYFKNPSTIPVDIDSLAKGIVAYKLGTGYVSLTTTASELWRLNNVPLKAGRLYSCITTSRAVNRSAVGSVNIFTPGHTVISGTTFIMDCILTTDANYTTFHWSEPFTVSADGSYTFIVQAVAMTSGTAVMYTEAGSGIRIEDIGPNRGAQ